MDGVLQVQRAGEFGNSGGVCIHLVAGGGLRGAAMAAPVVGNDAEAL